MVAPSQEQLATLKEILLRAPYRPELTDETIKLTDFSPIPEADSNGFRRAEGWGATWETTIDPGWANLIGNLHGAAAAWLIDTLSSASVFLIMTDKFWGPPMIAGVTVNLNIDYLHPAPVGTPVVIKVEILKMSLTIGNIKTDICDKATGKLLMTSTHLKAWRPPPTSKL